MENLNINTERILLFPLNLDQLRFYLEDPERLEESLGIPVSSLINTEKLRRALGMKIQKMGVADESDHVWYTYWLIVIRDTEFGAGMVGFKGLPNEKGEVEIGYGIDPDCQGHGYMTEAVGTLIGWAFQQESCRSVIAQYTNRLNVASNRVLEKVGMRVYRETDEALSWRIDKKPS
ncbi:MAG: GNAT family N-acetyltransferase [Anaerolineales bacterium]|nr:GNAT family N-acetyltransferase [Anaerolineales bacterium]